MLLRASYIIAAAAVALLPQCTASPIASARDTAPAIRDGVAIDAESISPSLLANQGYLDAWASATGYDFSTTAAGATAAAPLISVPSASTTGETST